MNSKIPMNYVETLFTRAAALGTDSDEAWSHIEELRKIGSEEVFGIASNLCRSPKAQERSLGVCILAQIGGADVPFQKQVSEVVGELIENEQDDDVVTSLISAISFQNVTSAIPWLIEKASSDEEDIRWRIAWALPLGLAQNDPWHDKTIATLIRLSQDDEPRVRDWATFSLATQTDDCREIVANALLDRVDDSDFDTRSEALRGLARRADLRVTPYLRDELSSDRVGELAVEAAEILALPELLSPLKQLSKWWDVDAELLANAIKACSSPTVGLGDSQTPRA